MKIFYLAIPVLFFFACKSKQKNLNPPSIQNLKVDSLPKDEKVKSPNKDNIDWQEGFGLTHNPNKDSIWFKPVSFYLSNKECSKLAKDFYYGKLKPSDDSITNELLKLSVTDNDKLRPFYRWCLNKTILIQDGALGEHTGIPARRYAEKFPREFFEYMDIDTSGNKYLDWVNSILYSGFYEDDDYKRLNKIRESMSSTMKSNCKNCNDEIKLRIEKFVNDCFQ
jgi:hypothetical protein